MKKVVFLGGAPHQIRALEIGNQLGFQTICIDNVIDNPGHDIASISRLSSTTDICAVVEICEQLEVDAIYSYGSDVAMCALGQVNDALGLVGPTLFQCETMTKKNTFRRFLSQNNLQQIKTFELSRDLINEASLIEKIIGHLETSSFIVKPTDRSGGLGISVCKSENDLRVGINLAVSSSISGDIIVEEYLTSKFLQICGDGYIYEGKIQFLGLGNNFFHESKYGPFAEVFPPVEKINMQTLANQLEKIFELLEYKTGSFNLDILRLSYDNFFVVEVTPRLGGNHLSEAIFLAYGVDLLKEDLLRIEKEDIQTKAFETKDKNFALNVMLSNQNQMLAKNNPFTDQIISSKIYKPKKNPLENVKRTDDTFIGNLIFSFATSDEVIECVNYFKLTG